jgi:N-acetylglucosaminyl-diphospho-decaprenol L-rhamnosyltransferase
MTHDPEAECSVVIVNYRTDGLLDACLSSLSQGSASRLEIIVVDNSASLRTSGIPARFPKVRFIENTRNVGFASACNQGLVVARGRSLLLLNPDTLVEKGAIETLAGFLDAHPGVGAVGPRLLDPDGSLQYSCRRFPGYFTIFFGRYSLATRLAPRNPLSRKYLYLDWNHASVSEVDWLSGACLMVRREVLESIGPLDEQYFLFVEDMDYCRRIRDAGWAIVYVPSAVVSHRVGVSQGPVPPSIVWARHRGMFRYVRKHFRSPWPLEALLGAGLFVRAGIQVVSNSVRGAR